MKLLEIFRFELSYQIRRSPTWFFLAVLLLMPFWMIHGNSIYDARNGDYLLNSPYAIAVVHVFTSLIWLLIAAPIAGAAAARDVQTKMDPLAYTSPVSKREYLGGRFLAAFVLNGLILLAVPVSLLVSMRWPGVEAEILGPFRPAAYLGSYFFIALGNAFVVTAIQFSIAALFRRPMAGYLVSLPIFVMSFVAGAVAQPLQMPTLGKLLDPIGFVTGLGMLSKTLTPIEKNTLLVPLEPSWLWNRLFWVVIALGILAFTHLRFHFGHPVASSRWSRFRRRKAHSLVPATSGIGEAACIPSPQIHQTFGLATQLRQALLIGWTSSWKIARGLVGVVLITPLALLIVLAALPQAREFMGVPLIPRTEHLLAFLASPLTRPRVGLWMIIPLLTLYYAGRLIWREREAGIDEITDAAPVREWVLLLGKFLGLGLLLAGGMGFLMGAGILVQTLMGAGLGYRHYEPGLYLEVLFGLQFTDYLLFALLVLVVHVVVNRKYLGHLASLAAYGFLAFSSTLGIQHKLLIYGSDPGWAYTEMRGFEPFLGPWLWFKLYWAAWALLLAVVARLLWMRGREQTLTIRLRLAARRFTNPTALTGATASGLVLILGGFIFYNTNSLNDYTTPSERVARRAEYEQLFGRFKGIPQPRLKGTSLNTEIFPQRREVEIRGSYLLSNDGPSPIDSVHLATRADRFFDDAPSVETSGIEFDRPAKPVLQDEDLGYHIYALEEPLQPGDTLQLDFHVHYQPHGFGNDGVDASVVANGTYFTNESWLPAIGYQAVRELNGEGNRKRLGLASRPRYPSLYDMKARQVRIVTRQNSFDAVVSTVQNQIAIAPGRLRRTWTEGGRRYFHYSTNAPISNQYAIFSAAYALRQGEWIAPEAGQEVAIEIFYHPGHATNVERMLRSVQASLDYYTRQFGPYPYDIVRIVEHPGHGLGMHAEATTIDHQEGFSLMNPGDDERGLNLPHFVVAHEVAHQWWGAAQLAPARVEGAGLLVESLATYSGMMVLKNTYGEEQLRRYLSQVRRAYQIPRTRAAPPLIRAAGDDFLYYRKGPFALYAMSEYIGAERLNHALRRLLEEHPSGEPPLPTSLDLYRELQAVTPDSYQSLLHDLFQANTFWELETRQATARQTEAGDWQVTLQLLARKVVVDETGVETPEEMDDWIEVGVFAPLWDQGGLDAPLYRRKQRIRSGEQTITLTVPRKPSQAGIDPYHLLIDSKLDDNVKEVEIES